jgi:hypothetical protein
MRLLVLIGLAAIVVTALQMQFQKAEAIGAPPTVNSTANTDDGVCNGPPNKDPNPAGNCTLHEAIDRVNAGGADTIEFSTSGTIDVSSGLGQLPDFTLANVTINSKGRNIILLRLRNQWRSEHSIPDGRFYV